MNLPNQKLLVKQNAKLGSAHKPLKPWFSDAAKQSGAALLITMIVVLALSVVAVGVTGSNQAQSLMARSSQFRMESFNASYAEIDAQLDKINKRKISDGLPAWMSAALNDGIGARLSTADQNSGGMALAADVLSTSTDRWVASEYRGDCVIFGQQIGAGKESYRCNEMVLESSAKLKNANIESRQSQVYEYYTKN